MARACARVHFLAGVAWEPRAAVNRSSPTIWVRFLAPALKERKPRIGAGAGLENQWALRSGVRFLCVPLGGSHQGWEGTARYRGSTSSAMARCPEWLGGRLQSDYTSVRIRLAPLTEGESGRVRSPPGKRDGPRGLGFEFSAFRSGESTCKAQEPAANRAGPKRSGIRVLGSPLSFLGDR